MGPVPNSSVSIKQLKHANVDDGSTIRGWHISRRSRKRRTLSAAARDHPRQWRSGWSTGLLAVLIIAVLAAAQEEGPIRGTLLFLHVWKCGGTSLRKLVCSWATKESLPCATVASCRSLSLEQRKICLFNHKLIFPEIQAKFIAEQRAIAGHFQWGFQAYAAQPHLLVTTLRNPLELFVSGEQYLHRDATATLSASALFVATAMRKSLTRSAPGFLHRFVGRSVTTPADIRDATVEGGRNLKSFYLVGVVEQYTGFVTVLRALLDPADRHANMWDAHLGGKLNASPVQSFMVLEQIEPKLVAEFNETLRFQWLIYGHAVRLFQDRCQEVLPSHAHLEHCHVPLAPSSYL